MMEYMMCAIINNNDKKVVRGRRQEVQDLKFQSLRGFRSARLCAVQVKFIIFPICPMHTYAHHASVWQLIWQRSQAQNVPICRLSTPGIHIYRAKTRRPRSAIITLCRPECSIHQLETVFFVIIWGRCCKCRVKSLTCKRKNDRENRSLRSEAGWPQHRLTEAGGGWVTSHTMAGVGVWWNSWVGGLYG